MSTITTKSPLLDLTAPVRLSNVAGKTILITGGASGLGEAMFRQFAKHGANVIIGDLNAARGEALVAEVRKATSNDNHHFVECDVTSYAAQRHLFTTTLSLSPSGTLHTVIANAGVAELGNFIEPHSDASTDPPEPDLTTLDVNLKGVVYTTKLAFHHFERNAPGEDQHLLLIGSLASIADSSGSMALYTASKHAILGFFRCLRMFPGYKAKDVRINLLCPYFVATPILPTMALVMLSGLELATAQDVVEAAARLVCDESARGRCLAIAPKGAGGIMEVDVETMKEVEGFAGRVTAALNARGRIETVVRAAVDLPKIFGVPGVVGAIGIVFAVVWLVIFR